jgi:large subunit ribosomal protein MRP49
MLPRIKYRNPTVPVAINRHRESTGPSLLHIYTSSNPPSTSPPISTPPSSMPNAQNTLTPDTSTPTHTIDINMKDESEILHLLIEKTGATVLTATPQELEEQEEIAAFKERSEKDRVEVRDKLMKVRREEELLRLARGETASIA